MGRGGEIVQGSEVRLREVFRPFGTWDFDGPLLHAGTLGMVEAVDPKTGAVIVRFPGHLPVRVPRSILRTTGQREAAPSPPNGPPPGL